MFELYKIGDIDYTPAIIKKQQQQQQQPQNMW